MANNRRDWTWARMFSGFLRCFILFPHWLCVLRILDKEVVVSVYVRIRPISSRPGAPPAGHVESYFWRSWHSAPRTPEVGRRMLGSIGMEPWRRRSRSEAYNIFILFIWVHRNNKWIVFHSNNPHALRSLRPGQRLPHRSIRSTSHSFKYTVSTL